MKRRGWITIVIFSFTALCVSCREEVHPDAYGYFEAQEWIVPADGTGRIISFLAEEGAFLQKDQVVGYIDTVRLSLQKGEIRARIKALMLSIPDAPSQLNVIREKRSVLQRERERVANLLRAGAVDQKQIDRIDDEMGVLDRELSALSSTLSRTSASLLSQVESLDMQLALVEDQIARCVLKNPEEGLVLDRYVKLHEYVTMGSPLYKLANLDTMELNAWFSGSMLSELRRGGLARVAMVMPGDTGAYYNGTIVHIAREPEFTPSRVQSAESHSHMLYKVRIRVVNDGKLKPGMPGEATIVRE